MGGTFTRQTRKKVEMTSLASSRLEGKPPEFSRVAAGSLDLLRGHQGPALVASDLPLTSESI